MGFLAHGHFRPEDRNKGGGEDDGELAAGELANEPEVTNVTTAASRTDRYQEHDLRLTLAMPATRAVAARKARQCSGDGETTIASLELGTSSTRPW
jgi:hypothetical protein